MFSSAQNTVEFRQLRGENVPTQSITYAVANDSLGNVWIASEEGVLKHNSKFYKIYNSYNGLPDLVGNRIKEVFVDSKQRVWIGSEKGVCLYNADLDVFEFVESSGGLNPSLVDVIIEDDNHIIWVGGFNGLWKYDEQENSGNFNRVLGNYNIQALHYHQGNLIFGTQRGAFYYNYKTNLLEEIGIDSEEKNIRFITSFDDQILIGTKTGVLYKIENGQKATSQVNFDFQLSNAITDIIKNSPNTFFLATDGDGIYKLTSDFNIIDHYTENPNEIYSISSNGVYDIELNREGILWAATYGGGLNYINLGELPFQNIRHKINDENSIVTNFTRTIAEDKNGNIWFGTKKGISILDLKNNSWKHIKNLSNSNLNEDVIVLALEPDNNFMWAGTYNEGLYKINIDTFKRIHYNSEVSEHIIDKVYSIHKDSKNNIWAGGIEKDLNVISSDNKITTYPIQQIKSISEIKSGEILVSGRQGVFKINHQLETFGLIEDLIPEKKSLAYSTINTVYETQNGQLILATNGEGLVFYSPEDRTLKKLKIKSGMPSDIIQGIIVCNINNLWASTTKGLVNIKIEENDTIVNIYDKKDGLASTEFNYGSFKKLDDDLIAFGGIDGVTMFNPNTIKNESYKPRLVFDTFKLSNKVINPGQAPLEKHIDKTKNITLNHKDNSVEIQFTGILHSSSSKVKYSWILEGFDETWSIPSSTNIATYTNLNPGDYTFKVKANNKFGNYGNERQLKITINSPWWATNRAYVLYAFALIALFYTIIHFTSVIIKKKNADEQIDFFNNITHEIKTPLTILISSLDNVTENINNEDDSKKRIKTTVKRINSLFEQMLNFQKVTSANNVDQDVSKLDVYAHIQQRINNFKPLTEEHNIEIVLNNNWNEDFYYDKDSFDKIMLNLISNAIKYSFENGKITINASKTQMRDLKIEVIDEGIGIPKDQQKFILKRYFRARNVINSQRPGTGLGLMMVKKLLEKNDGSITFESQENKGTTFTILMKNLKYEYDKALSSKKETVTAPIDEIEDHEVLTDFSNSKILIVEDNDELRNLLSNTLGNYFQIFEAKNGKEGLEVASTIFPDLILTDLIMPEMDGMQMAKHLKEDISLNHIPVFMLTVLQNSEQKLESIETGITEYLEKPVDIKYLLAKIINTLKWQQKLRIKYVHDSDADSAEIYRNKNDHEFLTNLENTVIENIENNNFSVHDLSSSFGMSRTSLYMKLKNLVDLSPQDFVIHTKLKHAKNLLIKGEHSIKEVAYLSGFSNPKYFSTSFKKFYGMTPTGFLESLKK
ncbi:ATP-binding protein [Psychroserpens sp. SPM9]|uniref:hybrid sensor histidine kinase/response regulator transcription factor n=1 Tax=Psychroserpens sp. SPM9 TaxID=2975598 RepID=UPI0021A70DC3|nr:ATP-binding protein [Psychroserpens sp. SPM9]MDG5490084.1 ATP-binding protein [Psychroserpens sp. SPM9]